MSSVFKSLLKKPLIMLFGLARGKYLLYFFLLLIVATLLFVFIDNLALRIVLPLALIAAYEYIFRLLYKYTYKKAPPRKFNMRARDIPFEEHPYLPWVYRKNYVHPAHKIYEDTRQGYMTGGMPTNNLRHVNGPEGDRDVVLPKPSGMYRIICLGDSTTCNYMPRSDGRGYTSWPLALENKLLSALPYRHLEVDNCGQGGYNTSEILIKFLIDTIDTQPDMVILYHAFVNVRGYLTPNFARDFYHCRRTMAGNYPARVRIARLIPDFGLWSLRYLVGEYFSYLNIKEDHVRLINRNNHIDRDKEPEGLETFRRNLETLIHVCKGRNISLIMSTYQYHLYEAIADSPIHIKFHDTVMRENEIIKDLAKLHGLPLVDNQALIPADPDHYIDEVHPTEKGMVSMADNFYSVVLPFLESQNNAATK